MPHKELTKAAFPPAATSVKQRGEPALPAPLPSSALALPKDHPADPVSFLEILSSYAV